MTADPTRLLLVRHGQLQGYEQPRYNGQADVPLTEKGLEQYRALCGRLASEPVAAVYCSDLSRCERGAHILAAPHGLPSHRLESLRELHIGRWEGKTWQEIQNQDPLLWQRRLDDIVNTRAPGGECLQDLADRVRPALASLLAAHPGQTILVVAHGGVNRVILLDAIGAGLDRLFCIEQDFGCLNIIDYYPDGNAVVKLLNG